MRNCLMVVVLFGVLGCGAAQPGLKQAPVNVSGKVSKAGQPLGNIAVSFQPLDHGHLKSLPVNPDGTFQGELISGTYAFSIAQSSTPESQVALGKVPAQYLQPDLQRTVTVTAGEEVLIVLD